MDSLNKDLLELLEGLLSESDDEFDAVLKQYANSRDKIKQLIAKLFMDYSVDGELNYSQIYMTTIIDNLEEQVVEELNKIGTLEIATITTILGAAYVNAYYKSAFTLEQRIGIQINFIRVNEAILNQFINQNWSGKHFSERIWMNQNALREALIVNLERGIREGHKLDKIAKVFDNEFGSKSYQSQRLVRTETARIISESKEHLYRENGIRQVEHLATLEKNTCSICADLDGQIFDIDDASRPRVPIHPNCKCDQMPVIEGGTNFRKDNETKEYIPYKNYREWEKAKGL
ncbi:minor capsid protein [Sutcliffiella horikoshii]|uniref:minor capsid protein n=1 Tax=Sutcliffiella horikoshii TaxID=79883 RepID=UPI00384C85DB